MLRLIQQIYLAHKTDIAFFGRRKEKAQVLAQHLGHQRKREESRKSYHSRTRTHTFCYPSRCPKLVRLEGPS